MPEKRIAFKAGQIYHVWTHANGSENLFREAENYGYFLDRYSYHVHPVVETFAYCLMPNHLHLLVRVREEDKVLEFVRLKKGDPTLQGFETLGGFSNAISRQFSHLFNGYTQAYNNKYDRQGSLFMPNFKRKLVDSTEYGAQLIAYIHANPVHHGFVKNINDWPHSSWPAYTNNKSSKIRKAEGLRWFSTIKNLKEAHRQINMQKIQAQFEQ